MLINYFKSKKSIYDDALAEGIKKGINTERRKNNIRVKNFKKEVNKTISHKNKKIFSMRKRIAQIEWLIKKLTPMIMKFEDRSVRLESAELIDYKKISDDNKEIFQKKQKAYHEVGATCVSIKKLLPSLDSQIESFKIEDAGD